MRMLVLGIDGGDERIFRAFDMPNFKAIAKKNVSVRVTEDLWSRGWAKMLTDSDVLGSGGVYERPLADGSRSFTQRFGRDEIDANPHIRSLWELLAERGVTTGFMNIPGTFPATPINGFFVSGAGAGIGNIDGIPGELCSSEDVQRDLESLGYVPDTRFMVSGIRDEQVFFDRLEFMLRKRVEAFVFLARKHASSFGMLALMATSRVQYLAMHDIQELVDRSEKTGEPASALSPIQERIRHLYSVLDEVIGIVFNEISPERFIITADHGAVPFRYTANANAFLARIGVLTTAPGHETWKRLLDFSPTKVFPYYFLRVFAHSTLQQIHDPVLWTETKAFGHRYVPGIYLNDDRFRGPVTNQEKSALVANIVGRFNASPEAAKYAMQARPYRERHLDSLYERILPDIWIDAPDDLFFEGSGAFVEKNPYFKPLTDLAMIHKDMYAGLKGKHPVFITDSTTESLFLEKDPRDLTLVYKLADRTFQKQ